MILQVYTIVFIILIKTSSFGSIESHTAINYLNKASELHYVDIDSAWYYIEKAEKQAIHSKNPDSLGLVYAKKGFMYYTSGKYFASMQQFEKAFQQFNSTNNIQGLSYVTNGNGLIYQSQNELLLAEDSFRRALEMSKSNADSIGIARGLLNLGYNLNLKGESLEALRLHRSGLSYLKNYPNHRFVLMIKNQIAQDLIDLNRVDEAETVFLELVKQYVDVNYWEQAFTYGGLAKIALSRNDYLSALANAKKSYDYALKLNAIKDMQRTTSIMAIAAKELNRLPEAYEFSQLNSSLKDSLFELSKSQSLSYLQLKLSETDKQRIQTEFELTKNQALFNSYVIISLLILTILLILAVYFFRRNSILNETLSKELSKSNDELKVTSEHIQQKNIQLQKLNDEKIQLISVISHDLKSPFNSMQQIILLSQDNLLNNEDHIKLNKLLLDQFNKTKELMNEILEWANRQLSGVKTLPTSINVTSFVSDIIDSLNEMCTNKHISILFPTEENTFTIKADKDQFRIILHNLMHNALKFSPEKSTITIKYEKTNKEKIIHICDEGDGLDDFNIQKIETGKGVLRSTIGTSNEQGTGLGLLLVKQFLVNNNGYLSVKSELEKGSIFTLHFQD